MRYSTGNTFTHLSLFLSLISLALSLFPSLSLFPLSLLSFLPSLPPSLSPSFPPSLPLPPSLPPSLSHTHHCRCIRPNELKSPDLFQPDKVLVQLRYTGVLETTRIRKEVHSFLFYQIITRLCLCQDLPHSYIHYRDTLIVFPFKTSSRGVCV